MVFLVAAGVDQQSTQAAAASQLACPRDEAEPASPTNTAFS